MDRTEPVRLPSDPARNHPRLRIWRPSSERLRDLNPPDLCAAQRTLRPHPPPCQLPSLSFPYKRALLLLLPKWRIGPGVGPARASQVPSLIFPSMSSLIPRRRHKTVLSLFPQSPDADFAHKIGARPPLFSSLRGYLCVHIMLRPGRLRCTLAGYVVESLSVDPFPIQHRLLASWLQCFATVGTWSRTPSLLTQQD